MHTNLDAAQGGVNDALAGALGLTDVALLGDPEGIGRMGLLPSALALPDFLDLTRGALRPNGIRYCDGGKPVHRVAVGGGACGDFFRLAIEKGCDALVTADVKYDQFLDASALGLSLIDAGHFPTEDLICPVLAEHLKKQFPDLTVTHSAVHREVVQYYL
jgi:putative NIF3 family GTP cyclohydrolase 1 type 2